MLESVVVGGMAGGLTACGAFVVVGVLFSPPLTVVSARVGVRVV